MNREGYRDPTAEMAIRNVSRSEKKITKRQLIDYCWGKSEASPCNTCGYFEECDAFIKETGHVPLYYGASKRSSEYTDEPIRTRRRRYEA